MSNEDTINAMVDSLTGKIEFALELTGNDFDAALSLVKNQTTAGRKVWQIVLAKFGR